MQHLIPGGAVASQFILPGTIVERGGMTYEVTTTPLVRATDGALVFAAVNELGGIEPLVIERDVMVPFYNRVSEEEFEGYLASRRG